MKKMIKIIILTINIKKEITKKENIKMVMGILMTTQIMKMKIMMMKII